MRKISQWQIRMQTMVPSLARSDRLSVFQLYALPANATRQWYFENCFQGRTNLPNANKMLKKIIFILSVGELVSAQMLSLLSPTLFTRLVESNVGDPLMRKGFWDRRVANIISCWKELKYIAKSCFDVRENDFGERSMIFSPQFYQR